MRYDATLKELFQGAPVRLLELLTGSPPGEILNVEHPSVRFRRPDLVLRLVDGRLYHLELQVTNDSEMPWRMLDYYALLTRHFGEPPLQQVLYAGPQAMTLEGGIQQPALQFRYEVSDIREMGADPLLESPSLDDNLLAILCRLDDPRRVLRRILERIGALPGKGQADAVTKLVILSELRGLSALVREEQRRMPIPIDSSILDHPMIQDLVLEREARVKEQGKQEGKAEGKAEGKVEGEAALLHRQLERRFGPLPEWAVSRLRAADSTVLETWGLRLIDAGSLEEVFRS
jgi:predicted transposase YdaD